jgi:plasmid maintenance system antidote protein VapI
VVTEALLRQLAAEMDEEWKKLAMLLGVRNRRLQDIIRTKGDSSLESVVYEMLMTWVKNEQRSTDKVRVLL